MGEAQRRADKGISPRSKKPSNFKKNENSPRIFSWLPITQNQESLFIKLTIRGAWIGIGLLVLLWIVVRLIGPSAGWWVPADI
tara:strand:- start:23042 stop:23290 length:249 start_codon:yes stop_codon:yes gene_type:complete